MTDNLATPIVRVSVGAGGQQGNADSADALISRDGTYVAFMTRATNLTAGDTGGFVDVLVKDIATGALTLVSSNASGQRANQDSALVAISPDGEKVAFVSAASNLVAGDTNGWADLYIKTLASGAIERVPLAATGAQPNDYTVNASFSPDGTKIAYSSFASNLVASDTNGTIDVFVKDLLTGTVQRISTSAAGVQGNAGSADPVFSPDGTKVMFVSAASNLVAGDTNGKTDVFIKTLSTGAIERVSVTAGGAQSNGEALQASFSADGSQIIFSSLASNLVSGDTNGAYDVFVKSLATGAVSRVSTNSAGAQSFGSASQGRFSPDGKFLLFISTADDLVTGDNDLGADVFLKELSTGKVVQVSTTATGAGEDPNDSDGAVFSADGKKILFSSYASLTGTDTNGWADVYLKDLAAAPVPTLSISDASVTEGGQLIFLVSLSAPAGADGVSAGYQTGNGTALSGDFTAKSGTLSFAEGETTKTITIQTTGDTAAEPDETMVVTLSIPSGATLADGVGVGTIVNDDAALPALSISDASAIEGGRLSFTVSLSAPAGAGGVSVGYQTANGTASAGDFGSASGTLTFLAGETQKTILIETVADTEYEPSETIAVLLSGPTGATLADSIGTGTISNLPYLSLSDAETTEGGQLVFHAVLDGPAGPGGASIRYYITHGVNDFDAGPEDFAGAGTYGTLRFAAGASTGEIVIQTYEDDLAEQTEFLYIRFIGTGSGLVTDDYYGALGQILDNEPARPQISISDASAIEGGQLSFTVSLSAPAGAGGVSVGYQTANGTAQSGDFTATSGTLSFAQGETTQTITIQTTSDTVVEADETIAVTLSGPTGATLADSFGTGTIVNDDAEPLPTAEELFAAGGGKLLTLADAALAAYHLLSWEPKGWITPQTNFVKPGAGSAYIGLTGNTGWTPLQGNALGLAEVVSSDQSSFMPLPVLTDGIYAYQNAAALVLESSDALLLAFRGTNDNDQGGLVNLAVPSPDMIDWDTRPLHYNLMRPLVDAAIAYAVENNLTKIYVSGHSLGAAMVEAFMSEHRADQPLLNQNGDLITFEGVAFASPGYEPALNNFSGRTEDRVTLLWNQDDVITVASSVLPNYGDKNYFLFDNGSDSPFDGILSGTQHAMTLYRGWIDFLGKEGVDSAAFAPFLFHSGSGVGPDFDNIIAHVDFTDAAAGKFDFGLGDNTLLGTNSDELILGGDGNDLINAGGGSDYVLAGDGDDTLSVRDDSVLSGGFRAGTDIYDGGTGVDTIDLSELFSASNPGYSVDLREGSGFVAGLLIGTDTVRNVENVTGSSYDDDMTGNELENRLEGRDGADTLRGLDGNDTLVGGDGSDKLEGGDGNDIYIYEEGKDTIRETAGIADAIRFLVEASEVDLAYSATAGGDLVITVDYDWSLDLSDDDIIVIKGYYLPGSGGRVELLQFDDEAEGTFTEADLAASIVTLTAAETGTSYFYSTSNDETFLGRIGLLDILNYSQEQDDLDIYLGDKGSGAVRGKLAAGALATLPPNSTGEITGHASGASIGEDTLYNIDDVIAGSGNDTIVGSLYANKLEGGAGNDLISGGAGNDVLSGGAGRDTLNGGAGADRLKGGANRDQMTGGTGRDVFDFDKVSESGKMMPTRDRIVDFRHGEDRIDLATIDASTKKALNQPFTFIGKEPFHKKAGELHFVRFDVQGTLNDKVIVEGDTNGDGKADFQIELKGLIALTKGDFIL